ncbi:GGDEF domain-containing protein [Henriciella sp.]|uniref:GGDEF domain-containing protein n=1 Tax=Henriciella sp. TaxID=1968823 RepID=UPI00260920A7|nr:GGDEF domain-containing protein [Henriciella sp.]
MDSGAFLGLIVPAVAGCMCAIFLCFWHYNRQDKAALLFSVAFLMCTSGFVLNHFILAKDSLANGIVHNAFYVVGVYLLAVGISTAFHRTVPRKMLAALAIASVGAAAWLTLAHQGLSSERIITTNMIHGIMFIILTFSIWGIWRKNWTGTAVYASLWLCILNLMFVSPVTVLDINVTAEGFFDTVYWRSMNAITILSALALGGSLIAVCAMQQLNALRHDAENDYLTGLKTRRAFEESARTYCASRSGEVAASIILMDIDHFKVFNDEYGHTMGDAVISAFGRFLSQQTRKADLAGRVGGEEFCLLLPGTGTTGARQLATRLKDELSGLTVPGLPETARISASFGVAELGAATMFDEVYTVADAALYAAKSRGRDRVVCAEQPVDAGWPIRREKLSSPPQAKRQARRRIAS